MGTATFLGTQRLRNAPSPRTVAPVIVRQDKAFLVQQFLNHALHVTDRAFSLRTPQKEHLRKIRGNIWHRYRWYEVCYQCPTEVSLSTRILIAR